MTRVTNGIGAVTEVAYGTSVEHIARSAEPWATPLPHPMLVVDRIDTYDTLSQEHDVDLFAYRDGFYDGVEKQFRGYAEVVQTLVGDADHEEGTQTVTFDVGQEDPYRHGLQLTSVQTSGGRTLSRGETTYDDCEVAEVPEAGLRFPVRHLCAVATRTTLEEGRPAAEHVTLETRSTHDGYGNVVRSENLGVTRMGGGACAPCAAGRGADDFGAPCGAMCLGDEQFTETEYVGPRNTGGRWILGAASRVRSYGRAGSALVSETLNYYDGPAFEGLPLGQLTHGKVTRTTVAKAPGEPPINSVRNTFDVHGNVVATLDPLGSPDGRTHRREYTYDPDGLRVITTDLLLEDAAGPYRLRRETQYEALFDKPSESTAWMRVENGEVLSPRRPQSFAYDEFARITKRVLPGGDTLQNPTEEYAYTLADPVSRVVVRRRSQIGAQYDLESVRCLDGRGRAIQTRTRLAQGRWQVTGFTLYDRRSLPKAVSQPFVDVDGECDTAPPAGVRTQRYAYDATDRIVRTTEPDAEDYGTESVSQMEYLPLVTVSSDANDTDARSPHAGTPTTRRSDGLGRTVALERTLTPNGAPSVVTALYDGLGRMTGYLDPAGHRKTQTYDLAGRLLSIDDPNAGVTRFVYDDAGNLLERTDARGETVVTEYDGANRPVARFDAADPEGTRVVMRYDGCDDEVCSNPEGVLSEVTYPGPGADLPGVRSAPGRERYGYDVRGRSVYASRQIEGVTYSQTARYDNADRLRANDYPDGHSIERRYDDASRLIAIEGLIDDIEYDERGLVVAVTRADGTVDRTTHDSRLRLATLQTESGGRVLQGFEYTRDRVGNLTAIVDTSTEPGPAADAEIVHDAWYRSREVRLTIGGVDETLGWQFDALDNVVARTSSLAEGAHGLTGAFTYGDAGPNAVTAAGDLTLEYDAAGRVSRRGDLAMTWDYQGRLTRMGDDVAHVYGADQTRVLTAARGSVTHYALPDFDVRDGIASLYVRIGRQRIARLESAGLATMLMTDHNGNDRIDAGDALLAQDQEDENSDAGIDRFLWSAVRRQHLDRGAETTHLHADQQGSLTLATVDGEAVGRRGFLPTGESRGDDVGFVDVYGFTGQEGPEDPRDPLIHFQFRWLDPALGRWGSPDPLFAAASAGRLGLFGESTTAYAYVANGFFDRFDPTGLMFEPLIAVTSSILNITANVTASGEAHVAALNSATEALLKVVETIASGGNGGDARAAPTDARQRSGTVSGTLATEHEEMAQFSARLAEGVTTLGVSESARNTALASARTTLDALTLTAKALQATAAGPDVAAKALAQAHQTACCAVKSAEQRNAGAVALLRFTEARTRLSRVNSEMRARNAGHGSDGHAPAKK